MNTDTMNIKTHRNTVNNFIFTNFIIFLFNLINKLTQILLRHKLPKLTYGVLSDMDKSVSIKEVSVMNNVKKAAPGLMSSLVNSSKH